MDKRKLSFFCQWTGTGLSGLRILSGCGGTSFLRAKRRLLKANGAGLAAKWQIKWYNTPMPDEFWEQPGQVDIWQMRENHPLWKDHDLRGPQIYYYLAPYHEDLRKAQHILNLGSGSGGMAIYLPDQLAEAVQSKTLSVDISRAMLAGIKGPTMVADVNEPLKVDDKSFDMVTSFFLARYIKDLPGFLKEVDRLLTPGGRFVVIDHTRIGHQMETSEFDPEKLAELPLVRDNYHLVDIKMVSPEWKDDDKGLYDGPIYLFSAVKKPAPGNE